MLLLNPPLVRFGPHTFTDVTLLAIDRAGTRTVEEWTDNGPHPTFADVPEQRTTIRITRALLRDDLASPDPGAQHDLVFHTSPTSSDAQRRRVTITAVVTAISHHLTTAKSAIQTITLTALSPTGFADPITTTPDP